MKRIRDTQGFTLIELMIVVVIIGILAAIAIPRFTSVSSTAKQAEAAPVLKQACSLAEAQYLRNNQWPAAVNPITTAALPGWAAPAESRFVYSFTGAGGATVTTAVATPTTANSDLAVQQMNCETKVITTPPA